MRPGLGMKSRAGFSALIRHSIEWPTIRTSSWVKSSASPAATRIWYFIRSIPVTISVIGCSTCMRVFISMK